MAGYYDFMLDFHVWPSPQEGIYWVGHILGTLYRVCFIPSIKMIKNEGSFWVFLLLLGTFTFFVYGNLTLSIQCPSMRMCVHPSICIMFLDNNLSKYQLTFPKLDIFVYMH